MVGERGGSRCQCFADGCGSNYFSRGELLVLTRDVRLDDRACFAERGEQFGGKAHLSVLAFVALVYPGFPCAFRPLLICSNT
jgi:hypothetical protein